MVNKLHSRTNAEVAPGENESEEGLVGKKGKLGGKSVRNYLRS